MNQTTVQRRIFIASIMAASLAACLPAPKATQQNEDALDAQYVGRWMEILLGGDGSGFELFEDGTATSFGHPDNSFTHWHAGKGLLFLISREKVGDTYNNFVRPYTANISDDGNLHLLPAGKSHTRVFRRV